MRSSFVIKKLDAYKPCLLIVDVNSIELVVIGNRDFRRVGLSSKYFFHAQIKSHLAMYLKCDKFNIVNILLYISLGTLKA